MYIYNNIETNGYANSNNQLFAASEVLHHSVEHSNSCNCPRSVNKKSQPAMSLNDEVEQITKKEVEDALLERLKGANQHKETLDAELERGMQRYLQHCKKDREKHLKQQDKDREKQSEQKEKAKKLKHKEKEKDKKLHKHKRHHSKKKKHSSSSSSSKSGSSSSDSDSSSSVGSGKSKPKPVQQEHAKQKGVHKPMCSKEERQSNEEPQTGENVKTKTKVLPQKRPSQNNGSDGECPPEPKRLKTCSSPPKIGSESTVKADTETIESLEAELCELELRRKALLALKASIEKQQGEHGTVLLPATASNEGPNLPSIPLQSPSSVVAPAKEPNIQIQETLSAHVVDNAASQPAQADSVIRTPQPQKQDPIATVPTRGASYANYSIVKVHSGNTEVRPLETKIITVEKNGKQIQVVMQKREPVQPAHYVPIKLNRPKF